ncbi:rRNA maturation RNAse YbeY, partial [Escherichia coli]|uniref:rRNA maturation RNAse YbeY n=1 Tax=Escherichia coli TaxID=562 RepID=UPI0015970B58
MRPRGRARGALDTPCPGRRCRDHRAHVDAEEGQQLNREYRQKDYATNVLTFDYQQEPTA